MNLVDRHIKRWKEAALDTNTDQDRAEAAVKNLYKTLGKKVPKHFLWVKSPTEGVVASYLLNAKSIEDVLDIRFKMFMDHIINIATVARNPDLSIDGAKEKSSLFIDGHGRSREDSFLRFLNQYSQNPVMRQIDGWFKGGRINKKYDEICEAVLENLPEELSSHVRENWQNPEAAGWIMSHLSIALQGSMDAMWMVSASVAMEAYDSDFSMSKNIMRELESELESGVTSESLVANYSAMVDVVQECGWFFPHEDFVIMVPKPSFIGTNENGFHSEDGSAIRYEGAPNYYVKVIDGEQPHEKAP